MFRAVVSHSSRDEIRTFTYAGKFYEPRGAMPSLQLSVKRMAINTRIWEIEG